MMRQALTLLTLVLFCSWINLAYAQELKIGILDLKKVMDNYGKVKDSDEQLIKEAKQKTKEEENLAQQIRNLREKADLLKEAEKEKKQREIEAKVKELQDFRYQARTELRQKSDEKMREIRKDIKDVLEEYGKSRNYNLILDSILLHYQDKNLDITDDIVNTLNQRYKK